MEPCKPRKATYYRDIDTLENGKLSVKTYLVKEETLHSEGIYISLNPDKGDTISFFNKENQLKEREVYNSRGLRTITYYYPSGNISKIHKQMGKNGQEYQAWYPDGQLRYKFKELPNQDLDGEVLSYHPNGRLKRKELYVKGVRQGDGERYDSIGNPVDFYLFKEQACFDNSDSYMDCISSFRKYVSQNVEYPKTAIKEGADGRAIVSFIVNTEGYVVRARIVKSAGSAELDQSAVRVIESSPRWRNPGQIDGSRVNTLFTFPIIYSLSDYGGYSERVGIKELGPRRGY